VLETTTLEGLHDFVVERILRPLARPGERAIDLGAGSGALAVRLRGLGLDTFAADLNATGYEADVPFTQMDLNQPDFSAQLGARTFGLVTAIEVFEHVESPIGFLRNVGRLLKPDGLAVLTTPNMDSAPARVKFLLRGKLRMMDEHSEPTHISPIFWDLLNRQFLPRAGMELVAHHLYPPNGYIVTRPRYAWAFQILARLLPGDSLVGDNHVLVLRARQ
jgi:2-polyprenyl-3-methyl-5-hydroxy-6-metoxy-1,4-benzoquinol methylase